MADTKCTEIVAYDEDWELGVAGDNDRSAKIRSPVNSMRAGLTLEFATNEKKKLLKLLPVHRRQAWHSFTGMEKLSAITSGGCHSFFTFVHPRFSSTSSSVPFSSIS